MVVVTSGSADESGSTFTITGTDYDGNVQTETIVGPKASGQRTYGSKVFKTIVNVNLMTPNTVTLGLAATGKIEIVLLQLQI